MFEEPIKAEPPAGEQLIMRPATKADLDSMTWIVEAGFPDCPRVPAALIIYGSGQEWCMKGISTPEKYASLVVTAPVPFASGKRVVHKPTSIGVWDVAIETKPTGGDLTAQMPILNILGPTLG
ncbi:acyl-CoA N-acyltransferase [Penicillium mononematosum]|uniref:acyl-CoA N-acyltransferase n=1 Tax=Penicillium mononematosum TaxID=268346 RepID=UPI0025475FD4|nr:acyl-CoA N-acyltransferase [Penicillium mononematosum]KAJ6188442.1 acyl-CoA N-acyltransferase [Penicillium mononematosum]